MVVRGLLLGCGVRGGSPGLSWVAGGVCVGGCPGLCSVGGRMWRLEVGWCLAVGVTSVERPNMVRSAITVAGVGTMFLR